MVCPPALSQPGRLGGSKHSMDLAGLLLALIGACIGFAAIS
ncbi:MAG: hypothetical protein AVDCRST_MAG27-3692 [uncultured Craurococcus sp.]|uniref:Uncharacterized protein n=1 Tax=uncultured Craurococcus sp. TaxID=1135998 RepID=A0A6J4J9M6_9PROT|nr:MAG: hypothetical protein AVDCRST_MAG27-3692 [uncultured Craurococcus sp.]